MQELVFYLHDLFLQLVPRCTKVILKLLNDFFEMQKSEMYVLTLSSMAATSSFTIFKCPF